MAGKREQIIQAGKNTRFSKKNQPENPGRKPLLARELILELKNEGYEKISAAQINELIQLFLSLDMERLAKIASDGEQPIYVKRTARRLLAISDAEAVDFIEKLLDRAHGRAKQTIAGDQENPLFSGSVQLVIQTAGVEPVTSEAAMQAIFEKFKDEE